VNIRKRDQKYLVGFKMWRWKRMEKIRWTDRVRNEEVLLKSQEGQEYPTYNNQKKG
jgi:hypothetical protein